VWRFLAYFINILVYSTCFHGFLIKKYSDNQSYLDIDKNVTKYITGLSSELNIGFNDNEKSHIKDVRKLILIEEFVFIAFLILFFVFVYKGKLQLNNFKKAELIVFLIGLLSLIISLFFNAFFSLFHLIFFPQGNWQFSVNLLITNVYQQSFFQYFFVWTAAISLLIALIFVL